MYNALDNCLAHGRGTAFKLYCKTKTKQNENTLPTFIIVLCLYTYIYIFLPVLTMSAKQYFDIYKSSAYYYYYYYLHMYTKHKQNKKYNCK